MSDSLFAILVTIALIVGLALWVPCLHLCHRCVRKITRRNLSVVAMVAECVLALHGTAFGQLVAVNRITTIAGTGTAGYSGDGGQATSANLSPLGIAVDALGNVYIADYGNNVIRKVTASTGVITTVAGNGTKGFLGDGNAATGAELSGPQDIGFDASGNLYINDVGNARIRKVAVATGIITTIAGGGTVSGDGVAATSVALGAGMGIGVDAAGNVYFAEGQNNRVRRVDAATDTITTVAGTGVAGYSGDGGAAASAQLTTPTDVCVDKSGNIFIADNGNDLVRKVTASTGIITTYAGGNAGFGTGDGGPATSAGFIEIISVAVDASGALYITDPLSNRLRKVDPSSGIITSVVGGGSTPYATGGAASQTSNVNPFGVAADTFGNVFLEYGRANEILKVSPLSFPTTAVGATSTPQTLLLQATTAETIISPLVIPASLGGKQEYTVASTSGCSFNSPIAANTICSISLTFTPAYPGQRGVPLQVSTTAGNINFALIAAGTAPLVALSPGLISTIAGGCTTGCSAQDADGVLASKELLSPIYDVKVNSAGDIYFSDQAGVRKISAATGIVTTVSNAGTNFALDNAGNIYVQFFSNYGGDTSIDKVNGATGVTSVIAGKQGLNGSSSGSNVPTPGVPATQSYLPQATDVEVDPVGNVYLSTSSQIVRIDAVTNILTYVTGTPNVKGYSGDGGLATAALVSSPLGMVFDQSGNLYFSDSGNSVVRRIDAVTGNISTYAGSPSGTENEAYVGPATGTNISPQGLAIDSAGNLYINDQIDHFLGIRRVDAATNIMTTVAGYAPYYSFSGYTARATDSALIPGFALDSLGDMITFTQGQSGGTISKIDVSTSLISFPFTFHTVQGPVPPVGTPYPNATADTVNVTNIGNLPLNLLSVTGTNPSVTGSAYTLDDPANAGCIPVTPTSATNSLASGTSCFLAVDFTPTVAGANPGQIALYDNSLNHALSLQMVTLAGQGAAATTSPTITLTPTSTNFPDTQVGNISNSLAIMVSNTGTATANITGITIGGADPTSFIQTSNCLMTLANGSNCTINVTFTPTAANRSFNATVTVSSNDPNSPATATLTGKGLAAPAGVITLSPSAVTFTTTVGVTAPSQTVMLTNTGAAQVTLGTSPITVTGTSPFAFQGSAGMCGYTLAIGASCNASVSFVLNTTTGTYSAVFNTTYYATSTTMATASIPLTGTVTAAPAAQATLTPASYNYGNVITGTSAASQTFTLANPGTADLGTTSISIAGTNAASFSIRYNSCGNPLAAGTSCTINVNFTPTVVGANGATLTVVDSIGTQTSSIAGTGVAPPIAADFMLTATPATQSTYRGRTVTYSIQVVSLLAANPFTNAVALSVTGLPSGATATLTPASVVPGATGGTSTLTVAVPGLMAASIPASLPGEKQRSPARGLGISMACLVAAVLLRRRKRPMPRLLTVLLLCGLGSLTASIIGCGDGAGLAIPSSTSTLTITGTSGATTHSTTVTLKIQ